MTKPNSDDEPNGLLKRLFHGRSPGPLIGVWLGCFIGAGLVFLLEYELPAFHEVVKILYFVVVIILVIVTARFFRVRARKNRRSGDRRKKERRHEDRAD